MNQIGCDYLIIHVKWSVDALVPISFTQRAPFRCVDDSAGFSGCHVESILVGWVQGFIVIIMIISGGRCRTALMLCGVIMLLIACRPR